MGGEFKVPDRWTKKPDAEGVGQVFLGRRSDGEAKQRRQQGADEHGQGKSDEWATLGLLIVLRRELHR